MMAEESDSELDVDTIPNLSSQPLCPILHSLPNKRARLISWFGDRTKLETDMRLLQEKHDAIHAEFVAFEDEKINWQTNFEMTRLRVVEALQLCQDINRASIEETRRLFDLLIADCAIQDIKKPAFVWQQTIAVYAERRAALEALFEEYETTSKLFNLRPKDTETYGSFVPIVEVQVDQATNQLASALQRPTGTASETNDSSAEETTDAIQKLVDVYARLEEEIAQCELLRCDLEPFFWDESDLDIQMQAPMVSIQPSVLHPALKDFMWTGTVPGNSSKAQIPFDDLVSDDSKLAECIQSICKVGTNMKRKRTKSSSGPNRINISTFSEIPIMYPQLLSASSQVPSRYAGTYFVSDTDEKSRNRLRDYASKQFTGDAEAATNLQLLSEITITEVKIRELSTQLAGWQNQASEVGRAVQRTQAHLDEVQEEAYEELKPHIDLSSVEITPIIDQGVKPSVNLPAPTSSDISVNKKVAKKRQSV